MTTSNNRYASKSNQETSQSSTNRYAKRTNSGGRIEPAESLLSKAYRDVKSTSDAFLNSATGGLYEGAGALGDMTGNFLTGQGFNREGMPPVLTQPASMAGKVSSGIGSIAGLMGGGPGAVAKNIEGIVASQIPGALGKYGGKALAGASMGFMAPGDMQQRSIGAGIGAVTDPAISGIASSLKGPALGIINQVFKPGQTLKTRPTFPQDILEKGLIGSEDDIIAKSGELVDSSENKLQQMISGQSVKANYTKVLDDLNNLKNQAIQNADEASLRDIERVEKMIMNRVDDVTIQESTQFTRPNEYPKGKSGSSLTSPKLIKRPNYDDLGFQIKPSKSSIIEQTSDISPSDIKGSQTYVEKLIKDPNFQGDLGEANKLKRVLYGETPTREYGEFTENPLLRSALGIKENIEQSLPNMPIKQTNADIGLGSEAKRMMEKKVIGNAGKSGLNLSDYFIGGAGIGKNKPIEAGLLVALKKILGSTKARTGIANLLYNISKQSGNIGRNATAIATNRQSKEK